jgi:hypothetical protein
MYSTPTAAKIAVADEIGWTLRVSQGPPLDTHVWEGIWIYFWGMQVSFRQPNGDLSGGGHIGLQWGHIDGHHCLINYGMYDLVVPGSNVTTRGSNASLTNPTVFVDAFSEYGDSTYFFKWNYGDIIKFRIYPSPRQDWTAAELYDGNQQPPEYSGVDQKASGTYGAETAYRCSIKINDRPWIPFRDVLMKNTAPSKAITGPTFWTEKILSTDPAGTPPVWAPTDWPYSPHGEFRNPIWDGINVLGNSWSTHYSFNGVGSVSNVQFITDSYGQWLQWAGGTTRTNDEGSLLTPNNATFWDTPRPNVSPNPGLDPAVRVPTPRPWY